MCLLVNSKLKTAQKDFYTLKAAEDVTETDCKSFYQEVLQEYNVLYDEESKFDKKAKEGDTLIKGFHSYFNQPSRLDMSFDLESYNAGGRGVILCKIPKGTKYYLGTEGDIITSKILLVEPLVVYGNFLGETVKDIIELPEAFILARKICNSYGFNMIPS